MKLVNPVGRDVSPMNQYDCSCLCSWGYSNAWTRGHNISSCAANCPDWNAVNTIYDNARIME